MLSYFDAQYLFLYPVIKYTEVNCRFEMKDNMILQAIYDKFAFISTVLTSTTPVATGTPVPEAPAATPPVESQEKTDTPVNPTPTPLDEKQEEKVFGEEESEQKDIPNGESETMNETADAPKETEEPKTEN